MPPTSSEPSASLVHWSLVPQCGICCTRCVKDELIVVLSGTTTTSDGRSVFANRTERLPFLGPSAVEVYKDAYLCTWAGCEKCVVTPDVVPVHADCLEVFLGVAAAAGQHNQTTDDKKTDEEKTEEEALCRLWIASSWRTPWKNAPFLALFQSESDNAQLPFFVTNQFDRLGLPGMARLPPELTSLVRELSKESHLWRLNAAAQLAVSLAEEEKKQEKGERTETSDDTAALPMSILLSEVEAWERGRPLVCRVKTTEGTTAKETTKHASTDGFIRFVIDTHGLLRIERLPTRPAYESDTSSSKDKNNKKGKLAYALCEAKTLEGAQVHVQLGLGRLELPASLPGMQIWDTPTPPPIEEVAYMRKHPKRVSPSSYLHVVDLQDITGLTVLSNERILGIHAHTAAEPSAAATAARMALPTAGALWQYMPLAPGDRIEAVGVRKEGYSPRLTSNEMTIMVRKTLSGDTLLGYSFYDSPSETILTKPSERPRALVYSSVNTANGVVTDVGVYNVKAAHVPSTTVRHGTRRHRFNHSAYPDEQLTEDAFQSNVPLTGVTHLQMYTRKDDGLLRGIVLTYDNGGQRALGMCRVAINTDTDVVKDYTLPARLCFKSDRETGETQLRVDGHEDDNKDGDRTCDCMAAPDDDPYTTIRMSCLMVGRLEFAVDSDRLVLEHMADEEEPDDEPDSGDEDGDIW